MLGSGFLRIFTIGHDCGRCFEEKFSKSCFFFLMILTDTCFECLSSLHD